MRKLALLWLVGIALPAFAGSAVNNVTVEQLEQLLAADHGKADAKVAQQLSGVKLTERLSTATLLHWEADLPGPESWRSLLLLADVSAFLGPPAAELPATATPDIAAQRQMIALTVDYASKTIHQLPNFFATRDTTHFEDTTPRQENGIFVPYRPLHLVGRSSETVLYRDGQQVVDSGVAKGKKSETEAQGLTTWGEFGPILRTVLLDAAHGKLAWSHWEEGAAGPEAVFGYAVPREKSHYEVQFCCVAEDNGNRAFHQYSGYHGAIAIDPVNGAILRLTVEADLTPADPIARADMLVEYGPVEIGGKIYICSVKGVAISLENEQASHASRMQHLLESTMVPSKNEDIPESPQRLLREPLQTFLNDVAFERYHLFRAEAHIVTADQGATAQSPSASGLPNAAPTGAGSSDVEETGAPGPARRPAGAAPAENMTAVAPAISGKATANPPAVPEPVIPEIQVAELSGLPDTPATPSGAQDKGFTLRVTTRLVDVGLVAFDKKGHPVTDLKPEGLELSDDGRKQAVQFFSRASGASTEVAASAPGQPVFSNRRANPADTGPEIEQTQGNVTILLLDAGNLAWADLTYIREEMLRFLRTLPADERVGLYVSDASGFQVLEEGTTDHALLASKLSRWTASAQDLAGAQAEEQHSRQQFDEVLHQNDLQYVNGKSGDAPDAAEPVDPRLRDWGNNPGRGALSILAVVTRHLAAMPGHKNLVWITSDNVLADWTDQAVSRDKGSEHIEGFALRAEEVMNDAHVSVYPLDASQLETQAIDPAFKNSEVELAPSVITARQPHAGEGTGRLTAEMHQDVHGIQGAIREMAEATGGRALRRSGDIAAELNGVVEDGRAAYLLSFTPDVPADNEYHHLTVRLTTRRGVTLRYRTGYLYFREPSTLKDRFRQAIWQPFDVNEIAVSANPLATSAGATLALKIAAQDLELKQQDEHWVDKLDIFLVQKDEDGHHAQITGQMLNLALKPATYQKTLKEGIRFDQLIERKQNTGSIRIVVVDENSGRMGSITVAAAGLQGKP